MMNDELKARGFQFIVHHSSFIVSLLAGSHDRFKDFHVTGASAEIACESGANLGVGRLRRSLQKIDGGDYHAGRADAALRSAATDEGFLHGV
jgi:hypothetical protein